MTDSNTVMNMIRQMTDEELDMAIQTVQIDLRHAAHTEPNSEWHEQCFAGAVVLATEKNRRTHPNHRHRQQPQE